MKSLYFVVDVFAQARYSGNQLAVVVTGENIQHEQMQKIALEANFSETTFVDPVQEADAGYLTRIFTPAREISFAGHPILGTAWVIRKYLEPENEGPLLLDLPVGQIEATFEQNGAGEEVVWVTAPTASFGAVCECSPIAEALGLSEDDIDCTKPVQQMTAGVSVLIVPVKTLEALRHSRLDLEAYRPLLDLGFPPLVYLYCSETYDERNDFCVRFFFEAGGVREDPATGNGAAFFGAYLLRYSKAEATQELRLEQGHAVNRPSLILLSAEMRDGKPVVRVGGGVITTIKGQLL